MQIEWREGEVLPLVGVSTEAGEGACEGMEARIAIRKRCDREREVGIVSGAGGRERSAVNRAEVSSCGRAVSCCSSDLTEVENGVGVEQR